MTSDAREGMSWAGFLALDVAEVEDSDSQVDALYHFVVDNRPPNPGDCQWMGDPGSVGKMFAVMRTVLKVRMNELTAAKILQADSSAQRRVII